MLSWLPRVVSLLVCAIVVATAHSASGSDGGGRIAVIVGESGDVGPTPRLVIMDADGKNARVLGWIFDAALSPSGRVVAYESRTVTPEIWVAAADRRGGARRLVRNGRDAAWSPNGGAIAFVRGRRPGCCDHLDLWLGDLDSRKQRLLLRNARTPDWSPDGKRLAFVRDGDVWVVDLANKLVRRVIRDAAGPRWSPDGDRIAFVRERDSSESFVYVRSGAQR